MLSLIDEGMTRILRQRALAEIRFHDGGEREPSGRIVDGLHEDVLGADPSGWEGADLGE